MMKLLKKPLVAWIVCIALVLVATLVNTNVKFGRLCASVTGEFYGTDGIAQQLSELRADAEALANVSEGHGVDVKELRSASYYLQLGIQNQYGAAELYQDYDLLRTELTAVQQKLVGISMSAADQQTVSDCLASITEAQRAIAASDYDEQVRDFLRRYDRFPTRLLARLAGVELPEAFG